MTQIEHRSSTTRRASTATRDLPLQAERSALLHRPFDVLNAKMDSLGFRMIVTDHASMLFGLE